MVVITTQHLIITPLALQVNCVKYLNFEALVRDEVVHFLEKNKLIMTHNMNLEREARV